MNYLFGLVTCLIVALIFTIGWSAAHDTVAKECQRLGSFYVGTKVFECKEKEGV